MSKSDATNQMIRYLLGDLGEDEQVRLEEQFFTNEDAYQQLQALEDELRYDYAQGALSPRDRELFEKRFLTTPAERDRVALAKSILHRSFEQAAQLQPEAAPKQAWWRQLFALPSSTALASATAALAIVGAVGLLVQNSNLRSQLAGLESQQRSSQTAVADLNRQLADERARLEQVEKQPPPAPNRARGILSFALLPGLVRGDQAPKRLTVPPETESIRLTLEIRPPQNTTRFRASLQNLEGAELWSGLVTGSPSTVTVSVPARLLALGDYMIELQAAGAESARAGEYYFSVVR